MSGRIEKENWYKNKNINLLNTMPKIAESYYIYFKSSSSKRTESSCFTYLNKLNIYFKYLIDLKIKVDYLKYFKNIKPVDITIFLDQYRNGGTKQRGDSTVAGMFNAIKSFYSFLEDNEYIERNPCGRLKAPKVTQNIKPVIMTKEEILKVKDYILYADKSFYHNDKNEDYWRLRDYLLFVLGCRTGMRRSALASIDIDDIDLDNNIISVIEKGNIPRNIHIGDNTKEIISEWLIARSMLVDNNHTRALFISRKRERISSCEIGYIIKRYTEDVIPGKHITPHKMRSTCATHLWEETHDIYIVANQLGHSNLANTKRYTDISEGEARKAANVLDEL